MSEAKTLPDLLREGLDLVFVGINPSKYSACVGHYFARPGNRFWPCLSDSVLSLRTRQGLQVQLLQRDHDRKLLDYGIGFTDVIKQPTPNSKELKYKRLVEGGRQLREKLNDYRPRMACFLGVTGFYPFCRASDLPSRKSDLKLGLQPFRLDSVRLFLVPNPSGANAHFTRDDQTKWFDCLAELLQMA